MTDARMIDGRIIDGDGHFVEPDATFRDFLPAKHASRFPEWTNPWNG